MAPLARAMATKPPEPNMPTNCAATALPVVRVAGPYWPTHAINTLLSQGLLDVAVGIVGPGALATLAWLQGGTGPLPRQGLRETTKSPQSDIARSSASLLGEKHRTIAWICNTPCAFGRLLALTARIASASVGAAPSHKEAVANGGCGPAERHRNNIHNARRANR